MYEKNVKKKEYRLLVEVLNCHRFASAPDYITGIIRSWDIEKKHCNFFRGNANIKDFYST